MGAWNRVLLLTLNWRALRKGPVTRLQERRRAAVVGGLSSSLSITAEWVQVLPTARIDRAHSDRARSASKGSICPAPAS